METNQRTTVVGVFDRRDQAERAVTALEAAGFRDDQIGLAMRGEAGGNVAGRSAEESTEHAGGGAATGAVLGGVLGAIAALVIPGVGPVLALGTLGTVLAGVAVGAGVGALAGGLMGMGVPEEEARYYDEEFQAGRAIVTVNAGSRYNEAQNVLRSEGGHDIETRGARAAGTQPAPRVAATERASTAGAPMPADRAPTASAPMPADRARTSDNADTMKLREERLQVDKERVQTGQVEIGKRVVEEQKTMEVPITREEVVIERRPVNRLSDKPITEDTRSIEVPVTEERVNVEKQTVVREEIGVEKRVEQDTVSVNETVRHEEAVINKSGEVGAAGAARADWSGAVPGFRQHWQTNYGATGRWEEYEPMYRYGFDQYNSGRWSGRSWSQVEPELRKDWSSRYPNQSWDVASNPIKHAWDHLTSTPHTHT